MRLPGIVGVHNPTGIVEPHGLLRWHDLFSMTLMLARHTIFRTPVLRSVLPPLARGVLRLCGWRCVGKFPDLQKCVVIAAPHTSNWDFPVMMAFAFAFEAHVHWMGKDALFRGPGYWLFRWLGGIPVDRSRAGGLVSQAVQTFATQDHLILAVPPEGTRSRGAGWRSGFYRIAHAANVPVVMAYADFEHRIGGIGAVVLPSGDLDADMETFNAFYSNIRGLHPHLETEIQIAADTRARQ